MMDGFPVQTCNEPEDTSDEDQEDLPYDGDLGMLDTSLVANNENCALSDKSPRVTHFEFIAQACHTNSVLKDQYTVDGFASRMVSGKINEIRSSYTREAHVTGHTTMDLQINKSCIETLEYKSQDTGTVARTHNREPPSYVTDLLLRHLTQEELFNSSKYIEAETMPEVSFIDSVEETVLTKVPCSPRHSEDHSSAMENSLWIHRDGQLNRGCKHPVLESVELEELVDSQTSKHVSGSDESVALEEQSEICYRSSNSELTDDHEEIPRLSGFRSCSEFKYGQGQVHYPLPDFSKVPPKVKIPKSINPAKSDSKFPSDPRFQASPSMLRKSSKTTTVVIGKVLEDSVQPSVELPHEFDNQLKDGSQPKTSELVQHLQAEYDKLLTRYAEAENLIDQLRLGTTGPALLDSTFPPEYMGLPEMETAGKTTNHTDSKQIQPLPTGKN
nr:protein AKNAD1 [Paramormyrops kingsleyae]